MSIPGRSIWAIIPAAGIGARMQAELPKQYLPLAGATVIEKTLEKMLSLGYVEGVVVAVAASDGWWPRLAVSKLQNVHTVTGGDSRQSSVENALRYLLSIDNSAWALVHDAARPCVSIDKIGELVAESQVKGYGGILAAPCTDTVKQSGAGNAVEMTLDRDRLWLAHTPQFFPAGKLLMASLETKEKCAQVTDEASAMEAAGEPVALVADRRDNIKITVPEDLRWAERILDDEKN